MTAPRGSQDPLDDAQLIRLIQEGDRDAGDQLWRRYERNVRFFLMRKTNGRVEVTEDLHQEAFMALLRAAQEGRLTNPNNVGPFLYQTCTHLVIHWRRKDSRESPLEAGDDLPGDCRTDAHLITREARQRVQTALRRLSQRDKRILGLRYYKELSYAQIAVHVGITEENARQQAKRALGKLRRRLHPEDYGFLVTFLL